MNNVVQRKFNDCETRHSDSPYNCLDAGWCGRIFRLSNTFVIGHLSRSSIYLIELDGGYAMEDIDVMGLRMNKRMIRMKNRIR